MQSAIQSLVQLGPLPSSVDATVPILKEFESHLAQVKAPIDDDDARALVTLFGPDDCFGLAWSLVHLIETAPGWPLKECLQGAKNRWIELLSESAKRGRATD